MKKVVAISLIMVLMFQVFSKLNIIATFYLNQNYIASALCIEKDEPVNECQGHCQLKKQLDVEENNSPAVTEKAEQVLLFIEHNQINTTSEPTNVAYNSDRLDKTRTHSYKVYHPPRS